MKTAARFDRRREKNEKNAALHPVTSDSHQTQKIRSSNQNITDIKQNGRGSRWPTPRRHTKNKIGLKKIDEKKMRKKDVP
jgi:hypothetical protein